jgi:hypothetical protein
MRKPNTPTCFGCHRRHGETTLVSTLEPLVFGRPPIYWAWFDAKPPAAVRKHARRFGLLVDGGCWRGDDGVVARSPAAGLPRAREEVRLLLVTAEDCDEFHACPRCYSALGEYGYRTEPLPEARAGVAREQLAFEGLAR